MTKKISKLLRKVTSLIVIILFISAHVGPVFAEQIELTDNELDQVQAGGLNFTFDSHFGSLDVSVNNNADPSKLFESTSFSAASSAGSGQNTVNVTEASQAGLRAMVNINAAGSTVPVLLNLTIITGDNYGNITNSNDLNLSNYTTFQVQ